MEHFLVEELLDEDVGVDDDESGAAIGEDMVSEIASFEVIEQLRLIEFLQIHHVGHVVRLVG